MYTVIGSPKNRTFRALWMLEELGEAYDIRDFHDVVLTQGAMPLAVLEERVEAWIADTQAAQ